MKNIFLRNLPLLIISLLIVGFSAFKDPLANIWQPPAHDTSIVGVGTTDDPLAVNHPTLYAAIITQASTSAPTEYQLENLIDSDFTWTRDSTGSYLVEGSDTAFPDSTLTWRATLGAGVGVGVRFYRINDSLGYLKILNAAGTGIDLAGKAYVEIGGEVPD